MVTESQKAPLRRAFGLWVTRSTKSCGGVFCHALAAPIDANSGALMSMRGARSAT
jgi:hypothetical protein